MTTPEQERLRDIWSELGLTPEDMLSSQAQLDAVGDLAIWLEGAAAEPERLVQVVQVLLTDPQTPGSFRRRACRTIMKEVSAKWSNVEREGNLPLVQAMVLAAWPEEAGPEFCLPRLMRLALPATACGFDGRIVKHLEEWWTRIPQLEDDFSSDSEPTSQPSQALLSLLWWGQARYCHSLAVPFRRLSPAQQLWWTSIEAAHHGQAIAPEPTAAYLCEVLHALAHDLDEKRPLREWLAELWTMLQTDTSAVREHAPLSSTLTRLVTEDPTGLPIAWARDKARPGASEPDFSLTGVNLDHQLARGEWATWLLFECLLELRLGVK